MPPTIDELIERATTDDAKKVVQARKMHITQTRTAVRDAKETKRGQKRVLQMSMGANAPFGRVILPGSVLMAAWLAYALVRRADALALAGAQPGTLLGNVVVGLWITLPLIGAMLAIRGVIELLRDKAVEREWERFKRLPFEFDMDLYEQELLGKSRGVILTARVEFTRRPDWDESRALCAIISGSVKSRCRMKDKTLKVISPRIRTAYRNVDSSGRPKSPYRANPALMHEWVKDLFVDGLVEAHTTCPIYRVILSVERELPKDPAEVIHWP